MPSRRREEGRVENVHLPLLAAKRSALTTEALNTVVAPNVVEWECMFEPLAKVFSTLSRPPA